MQTTVQGAEETPVTEQTSETEETPAAVVTDAAPETKPAQAETQKTEAEEEAEKEGKLAETVNALPYKYRRKPIYGFFKRACDILLSGLLLLVIWPVFLAIAIAIKLDDHGPVLYAHKRVGCAGKPLYIHKFRSMKLNADRLEDMLTPEQLHQYYTEFKIDNDPRITKIGNFLRRTSLDELPQIWDIFIGRLSIIGPRPLVEKETYKYYDKREDLLSVKPGLTGYWQAYARNDVGYSDGKRQEMELFYVQNRSVRLDIKVFFKTIFSVLKHKGAK